MQEINEPVDWEAIRERKNFEEAIKEHQKTLRKKGMAERQKRIDFYLSDAGLEVRRRIDTLCEHRYVPEFYERHEYEMEYFFIIKDETDRLRFINWLIEESEKQI
ncbi:hypothetical protein Hs20B_12240 [Lactococcus insecticola]|uniref:Uncharacterized protein n=2 Tax=Pseudolactococcus insecticola TaxID=2709158 RepID=A0A6A0B7A5_9LACT|nr:hypothetical protein Hs20B_12240 [Lactococcus insecticola]